MTLCPACLARIEAAKMPAFQPLETLRVLVGCEESGRVRDAFLAKGVDAWSCDLVDTRSTPERHLKMDVLKAISDHGPWDIIILHPECTTMAISGNAHYGEGMTKNHERLASVEWTKKLWELAKAKARIGCALENPLSVIWKEIGKPQYIQPHQFGHGETKLTGILTHKLPPLMSTMLVEGREQRVWKMPPSATRKRDRSETYTGIAAAMAAQWSEPCVFCPGIVDDSPVGF